MFLNDAEARASTTRRHVHMINAAAIWSFGACSGPALADHPASFGGTIGSGPIQTLSAETMAHGQIAAQARTTLYVPEQRSDTELAGLASQHVHAHDTDYTLQTAASISYGLTDHLTLSASLPFTYRNDVRASSHHHGQSGVENGVERLGSVTGIGDATLIGTYQFAHSHHDNWAVSVVGGMKLPTGTTTKRNNDGERFDTEHQPGTGSWDPIMGLAASKGWQRWALHGSAMYQVSTKGAQDTELGDRAALCAAITWRALSSAQADLSLMMEASAEREGKQRVDGVVDQDSGAKAAYISPGLRLSSGSTALGVSVGIPVWQDVGRSHGEQHVRITASLSRAW